MWNASDDQAERASGEHHERLVASGQWENECARIWFEGKQSELRVHLRNCLHDDPRQWGEAACFAASLSDLCLWAERVPRITWVEAKARYEKCEAEAARPQLKPEAA